MTMMVAVRSDSARCDGRAERDGATTKTQIVMAKHAAITIARAMEYNTRPCQPNEFYDVFFLPHILVFSSARFCCACLTRLADC